MSKEVKRHRVSWPVPDQFGRSTVVSIELVPASDYDALLAERDALDAERAEQWRLRRDAEADRDTARAALAEVRAERDRMAEALKYYADGEHFYLANEDAWDTVSGEPLNILHHDDGFGESEGYVEDGSIARAALQGAQP